MPARAPFTSLCQFTSAPRTDRADLHLHSMASDGQYSPAQIVDIARRTGLSAIALTDHDTLAGVEAARKAAGQSIEVVPAVELSCEYQSSEVHLLAYFVPLDNTGLNDALIRLQQQRMNRYTEMAARLNGLGLEVSTRPPAGVSPGRRHLANELVRTEQVGSVREAFQRFLDDRGPVNVPKVRLGFAQAIVLIRNAGGVCSYAHPLPHVDRQALRELADLGLQAVEVEYPGFRGTRTAELRQWAQELGLATTGGSDCHGPDEPRRCVGSRTISKDEVERLRQIARG